MKTQTQTESGNSQHQANDLVGARGYAPPTIEVLSGVAARMDQAAAMLSLMGLQLVDAGAALTSPENTPASVSLEELGHQTMSVSSQVAFLRSRLRLVRFDAGGGAK